MKFVIAIAVVLALMALTQAQDESNQLDGSDQPQPSEPESPPAPPSDEPRPPRPEGEEGPQRPPRPGRPGRRPFGRRFPRPQPNEDQQADSGNPEGNRPQIHPPRQAVFFNTKYRFGQGNQIEEETYDV